MSLSPSSSKKYTTTLELLPTEIQCHILKCTQNLKTLNTLIRASPQYFSVFRASRESIISHVAWNSITPTVVPMALHALEQRDQRVIWSERISDEQQQQSTSTTSMTFRGPDDIPFRTWERLISFHRIVDSFILDFSSSRLVALENSIQLQSAQSSPVSSSQESDDDPEQEKLYISQIEYARLGRAFYRLDLFAGVFYDIDTTNMTFNETYNTLLERSVPFLETLPGWELDELLCVRSYIFEGLKNFLNQFEDEFMEIFLEKNHHIDWPAENTNTIDLENDKRAILFSDKGYRFLQEPWLEKCLGRGLKNLARMILPSSSASTFERKFFLLGADRFLPYSEAYHATGQLPSVFMSDALNMLRVCSKWWLEDGETNPTDEDERRFFQFSFRENNDIEKPNEAWSWAMNNHLPRTSRTWPGRDNHAAECWAYAIWDHDRLKRLGLITKT